MYRVSQGAKCRRPDSPDLTGRKRHRCKCGLLFLKGDRERSSECRTESLGLTASTIGFEQQSACPRTCPWSLSPTTSLPAQRGYTAGTNQDVGVHVRFLPVF